MYLELDYYGKPKLFKFSERSQEDDIGSPIDKYCIQFGKLEYYQMKGL